MPTRHAITVTTERGDEAELVAVHHAPADPVADTWVVFCHGFISDKSGSYESRCERAAREGYHAIRFDFRGCGESDGAFVDQTLSSKIADLHAVLDFFDAPRYTLFGSSFGAKTALHAAVSTDVDIGAVVTRAPVTWNDAFDNVVATVESTGRFEYDSGHVVDDRFVTDLNGHPFDDVTTRLDVPVAVFHGAADESVPLRHSLDAAAALGVDVTVQVFDGEGHRFSRAAEEKLRDQLFDWFARLR